MYLVVFRNRKRADIDYAAYEADAERMLELAQAQPGYQSPSTPPAGSSRRWSEPARPRRRKCRRC